MSYLNYFYQLASTTYRVNPLIFITLYLLATPTYYYGAAKAGVAAYRVYKKKKSRGFNFHTLISDEGFLFGYILNRFSWLLPYLYVIIFGRNLPLKFFIILTGWSLLSAYIFFHNIKIRRYSNQLGKRVVLNEEI